MFLLDLFHRVREAVEIVYTLLHIEKYGETLFGGRGTCENSGEYLVHA